MSLFLALHFTMVDVINAPEERVGCPKICFLKHLKSSLHSYSGLTKTHKTHLRFEDHQMVSKFLHQCRVNPCVQKGGNYLFKHRPLERTSVPVLDHMDKCHLTLQS